MDKIEMKIKLADDLIKSGNYESAIERYQQAAAEGSEVASYKLGQIYEGGRIVPVDNEKAYRYYLQAGEKYATDAARVGQLLGIDPVPITIQDTETEQKFEPTPDFKSESKTTNPDPLQPQKNEVIKYPDAKRDRIPLVVGIVISAVVVILAILYSIKHTVTPLTGIENLSSTEAHYNQMVTFSIVPKEGYDFDYVTINGENNGKDTMFRMPFRNVELEAHYTKKPEYKIEYDEKSIASISFNSAYEGKSIAFKIKPKRGYELNHVELLNTEDFLVTIIDKDSNFTMPAHNVKVSAIYKKNIPEIEMVFVKGGTFKMGNNNYDRSSPVHEVTVDDFYIGKYEVTQALWKAVMDYNPSKYVGDSFPVAKIRSWSEIQKFIRKLNEYTGGNYRLPTEAEWEYAARGGNKSKNYKYSGSNDVSEVAWYYGNASIPHKIGKKQPNELGIYDMSGNVSEWCMDYLIYDYYKKSPKDNPICRDSTVTLLLTDGSRKPCIVMRGGDCDDYSDYLTVYGRYGGYADGSESDALFGLRLVKGGHNFNDKK